jgi:hypothetical protein
MSMKTYHIENWDVYFGSIIGKRTEDDKVVTTSTVQHVEGNIAYTKNSIYVLGAPAKGLVDYCTGEGILFDAADPASAFALLGWFNEA